MQTSFRLKRDDVTPDLQKKLAATKDLRPILEAGGLQLVSWTQAAFEDPSKRILPWPARRSGTNPLLKKNGALQQSIRVASVSANSVVVGTDRKYAAFHQLGTKPYTIKPKVKRALFWPGAKHPVKIVRHPGLPARPFFPFSPSGRMMPAAQERVRKAMIAKLESLWGASDV